MKVKWLCGKWKGYGYQSFSRIRIAFDNLQLNQVLKNSAFVLRNGDSAGESGILLITDSMQNSGM